MAPRALLLLALPALALAAPLASLATAELGYDYGSFSDSVTSDADWVGHTAVRVAPMHASHDALKAVLAGLNISDLWRVDGAAGHVDVVVPTGDVQRVREGANIKSVEVLEEDVGEQLLAHAAERRKATPWNASRPLVEFFDDWRPLIECELFMEALVLTHPDRATLIQNLGDSVEGRPIKAVEIGGTQGGPAIYFQGTLHAREWISASTTLWILHELITSEEPRVRELLTQLRIVMAPVTNPDGYHYTWATNRNWRKNRQVNPGSTCVGVDLNRNWEDGHWGGAGASSNPCSDTFHGPAGMSEPETQAVERYLMQTLPGQGYTLIGAIDYHSFGQLILRPYGWEYPEVAIPPNDAELTRIGDGMSDVILNQGGQNAVYRSQYAAQLYIATGGCDDWLYTNATNGGFSYTFELPPVRAGGFAPPASVIRPTGVDNVVGALYFAEEMLAQANKQ